MRISFEDIRELHDADKTPAEIVAALHASDLTNRPVPLGDLMDVLNKRGVLTHLAGPDAKGRKWEGSYIALLDVLEAVGTPEQNAGAKLFFGHITNPRNNTLDLTDLQFSVLFRTMETAFAGKSFDLPVSEEDTVTLVMPTQDDFDAIADLGGGWRYRSLDAGDIERAIEGETERLKSEAEAQAESEAEDAAVEIKRIQTSHIGLAVQEAESSLPGIKADWLAAFTAKLDELWVE